MDGICLWRRGSSFYSRHGLIRKTLTHTVLNTLIDVSEFETFFPFRFWNLNDAWTMYTFCTLKLVAGICWLSLFVGGKSQSVTRRFDNLLPPARFEEGKGMCARGIPYMYRT